MRVIGDIPHPSCKITLFNWNGKYIIKLELGLLEQSYKIDESEVSDPKDIDQILDEQFMDSALKRFKDMHLDLVRSLQKL